METSESKNLAEPAVKSSNSAKKWLWLLPVLGICTLSFCVIAGGVIFWQTRSQQADESNPVTDLSLQNQAEDSFATTPPALTPTLPQTVEATAFTCPVDEVAASPAITAPLLSPISFATHQAADGWPLDTSLQFTTTITKVLATFGYAGLENGLAWERVWYFGDQELSRGSGVWDAGPAPGKLTAQVMAGQGGFAPGAYKLEIYVQGQLLSQGTFYIVKADTPTQRPVQVAYTTWNGQAHQLNLLDLTTSQTETLVTPARGPAWSPDAMGLVFYGEDGIEGGAGLKVLNMVQRKVYPLSQETFFQTIAWSSDRTYVASARAEGQESRLVLWDLFQNKAYAGPPGSDPAWSLEGQRLAYRGCDQTGWNISTIQVIGPIFDTNSIRQLTQADDSQPTWSWDGQRIAFVRRDGDNQDIYVMAADGSNLTRLTDNPTTDVSPAWTPDHHLVFRSWRDGQWGIYVMNADGSDQHQLITIPAQADWQPDRLAVSTNVLIVTPTPPKPQPQIPAGQGLLAISNQKNNDEMTFTIDNKEHKIGPYQVWMLPLKPGHYTWTASWPGKNSRTGIADIALGLFYKLSSLLFFLTYIYVFLLDKTPYNNHYYLIILLSFLLLVVDAHQWASLDKWRKARSSPETVPFWQLFILRAQIFIVYFYGGIAKLNGDWLRGEPMRTWLAEWTHYPVLNPFFATEWAVYFFSYGGLLFDLCIGFLLLWPRTRFLAFWGLLFFHLTNSWLFSIGVFPFLALALTILFFEPGWPRQMGQRFGRWLSTSWPGGIKWRSAKVDPISSLVPSQLPGPLSVWTFGFIILYLTLQLLIPLRHWLYAGNVSWTEEGHRFSWHMKLRDKEPRLEIKVIDPKTGNTWNADLREDLTDDQLRKMATRPDMILQYVHHLKEKLEQTGLDQPIIIANAWVSLNGRPFQRLIDPTVNLAQVQLDPFSQAPWILPLEEKLSPPTEPVLYFLVIVAMILANLGLALSLYFAIRYSRGLKREVSIKIHRFDEGYAATYTLPLAQGQVSGLIKVVSSILPYLTILLCLAAWVFTSQLIYLGVALTGALLAASWGFYPAPFLLSRFARSHLRWGPALTGTLTGLFLLMLIIVAVQG